MKVLFQPQKQRTEYFVGFLQHAKTRHGWHVGIVDFEVNRKLYEGIIDDHEDLLAIPDFTVAGRVDRDAAYAQRIDDLIGRCEHETGITAGRIVLAAERDIGRGLGREHYYQRATRRTHAIKGPFSSRAILRRAFAFAEETLDRFHPDLVIGGQNGVLEYLVIFMCAAERRIPYAFHRMSKLLDGHVFWTRRWDLLNELTGHEYAKLCVKNVKPSREFRAKIASFREKPAIIDYIDKRWRVGTQTFLSEQIFLGFSVAVWLKRWIMRQDLPAPALSLVTELYRRRYLTGMQRGFFRRFTPEELATKNYIYLPLHKEPEIAINQQAPEWRNQKNLIAMVSAALPFGYDLLVREHRYNLGRRPSRYYRDVVGYPNVLLIDSLDDQFKYIQHADVIITDNGSSGWEGLLYGNKVIQLSESFYSALEFTMRLKEPRQLAAALLKLTREYRGDTRSGKNWDEALARLLDAEYKATALGNQQGYDACVALLDRVLKQKAGPTKSNFS